MSEGREGQAPELLKAGIYWCEGSISPQLCSLPHCCAISLSYTSCLRWFHSKLHPSLGKTTILHANGSSFRHLLWKRSKERFCEQIPLWILLTSSVNTSQSMPFLLGAHSSTVESSSKENTLKSTLLDMTSPEKMCSANRDGQSKAAQEATPSCQPACHNTHTQFFPSKILLTLLDLKKLGAGCALLYLFSSEQGKSSPWLTQLPCRQHILTQRGISASQGLHCWSQSRLCYLSSSCNYGA